MQIEVWRKPLFRKARRTHAGLWMRIIKGHAFASRSRDPFSDKQLIPVSDELAQQVLGATREVCPWSNKESLWKANQPAYRYKFRRSGEGSVTNYFCEVCDFRASDDGEGIVHPETTYLKVPEDDAQPVQFHEAGWDVHATEHLVPDRSDQRLIIWRGWGDPLQAFWPSVLLSVTKDYKAVRVFPAERAATN